MYPPPARMDDNDIIIFMFTLFRRLPTKGEHIATVIDVIVNSRENSPILKFLAFITGAVSIVFTLFTILNATAISIKLDTAMIYL